MRELSKIGESSFAELELVAPFGNAVLGLLNHAREAGEDPPDQAPADEASASESYPIHEYIMLDG